VATDLEDSAHRARISELLSRYLAAVDDRRIDLAAVAAAFTPDGRLVAPNGTALVGREAIAAGQAATFRRFRATHHSTTDHVVEVEGDTARLRANMTAMHLWCDEESDPRSLQTHFVAGGVFEAVALRTPDGWRFSELASRVTWRTGAGLAAVARIGKAPG
jgi:uncharacterized protein (TIGR02246 family)